MRNAIGARLAVFKIILLVVGIAMIAMSMGDAVKIWKSDDERCYKLPADLGFGNSYVVITELSEGLWDLRRADQQEIDANKRKRVSGNV